MSTTVKHTYSEPTTKQVAYATSLAARKGYRYLSEAERACFGKQSVQGMNRADLSTLIDWLKK